MNHFLAFSANVCPVMISIFSLHTWDVFGKVVSGLTHVDIITCQNLLIAKASLSGKVNTICHLNFSAFLDTRTFKFCTELTIDKCYKMRSRPNKAGLDVCPYVRPYICPYARLSTASFSYLNDIWYLGRGQ